MCSVQKRAEPTSPAQQLDSVQYIPKLLTHSDVAQDLEEALIVDVGEVADEDFLAPSAPDKEALPTTMHVESGKKE